MHPRFLYVGAAFIFCCLLVAPASAQTNPQVPVKDPFYLPNGPGPIPTYTTQGSSLVVTVYRDRGVLLNRQAVVKLYNKNDKIASWHTTQMSSTAAIGNLTIAPYEVEVSAVGYLTGHEELNVQTELRTYRVDIILQHDPDSIELNQPGAEKIPSKARKDINRAVTDLKSGNLKDAQKRLDAAYKIVPSNSDINFLLGYLYFQKSQFQDAENYLVNATKADLHHVQALTLLGRLRILREDYKGSSEVLEQALAAESENWTAHNLLADAYLRLQEFEKARQQAQLAIETAKGAGNAARIPLAEALASLGRNPEALEALATFLQNAPQNPIAPQVRDLMAEI